MSLDWEKIKFHEGGSTEAAQKYLKDNPETAKALFDEADREHREHNGSVYHFELPRQDGVNDRDIKHHFTIEKHDGGYTVRPKHEGIF